MSEWAVASLGDIAEIRFSNVDKKDGHGEVPVRLCNYLDVYGNDYITANLPFMEASATRAEIERFRVEKGDVMVTKDSETPDDIGIPAVVMDEIDNLVCGYHLALIKPDRVKVDSVYLAKQLGCKPTAAYFSRLANGSTRYGLSSSAIASTPVWLAPRRQQRRIAEILSTLDETIEQTEALIAKYQQIKAGLMHDLFTRGVTPDGQLRPTRAEAPQLYKQSPLGWIPKEWEVVKGRELFDLYGGSSPKVIREDGSGDCLYLKVDDFNDEKNAGALRWSRASFKKAESPSLRIFSRGAIVFPKRGAAIFLNRVGVLGGEGTVDPNLMVALVKNSDYTDFIQLSLLQKGLFNICDNSGIPQINNKHLYPLDFGLPPVKEVDRICEAVRRIRTRVSADQSFLSKLRKQKHGLMHDLLTGRVRVKVDDS